MKVLFVSSGNRGISPVVRNQGDSLKKQGVEVDYFAIQGKGMLGYLSNVSKLRKYLRTNKYDIVHAHYSLTSFVASFAKANPLVVSLMGSDVKKGFTFRLMIKIIARCYRWKNIIVKSDDMKSSLRMKTALVIPNGVDTHRFCEMDHSACLNKLNWDKDKKHIVFPANIRRSEKNFALLEQAIKEMDDANIEVHWFNNVPNEETPDWYNAADAVVMTSLWEGSPNAIKEAMACNRPIVSTDVGNVKWLFGDLDGCYLSDFSSNNLCEKIRQALSFGSKTKGCQRIIQLGLSSDKVANQLIDIYHRAIC